MKNFFVAVVLANSWAMGGMAIDWNSWSEEDSEYSDESADFQPDEPSDDQPDEEENILTDLIARKFLYIPEDVELRQDNYVEILSKILVLKINEISNKPFTTPNNRQQMIDFARLCTALLARPLAPIKKEPNERQRSMSL